MRYFYAWTPLVLLGTIVFLSLPWLGLLALIVIAPAALLVLAAFAWAVIATPFLLLRSYSGSSPRQSEAHRAHPPLTVAERKSA
jgi:cytoskeletal protein RodZ